MELVQGSPHLVSRKSASHTWLSTLFIPCPCSGLSLPTGNIFLPCRGLQRLNPEPRDMDSIPALPWEISSHLRMRGCSPINIWFYLKFKEVLPVPEIHSMASDRNVKKKGGNVGERRWCYLLNLLHIKFSPYTFISYVVCNIYYI